MPPTARRSSRSASRCATSAWAACRRCCARRGRGPWSTSAAVAAPCSSASSRDPYTKITGVDVSIRALEQAARRLKLERLADAERARIALLQSPLTYRDRRLTGYDAAALVEVVEHLDPPRLAAAEQNVFGSARPQTVVVTTQTASTTPTGRRCRSAISVTRTTASNGRAGSSRPGRRAPAPVTGTASASCRSAPRIRSSAHPRNGRVRTMRIDLPDPSLVVLVGASGCGKSSRAARHFRSTEVLSSDFSRGLVADDENDQSASRDAFAVLHEIARRRLANLRLTVVDATNVQREARRPLVELAREHDLFPVAVVLDLPEAVCQERNRHRADRDFGAHVVRGQRAQLRRSLKGLQREGFRRVWILRTPEDVAAAEVARSPLWTDRRSEHGPFDVIGDVHGCYTELVELLDRLGYAVAEDGSVTPPPRPPRGVRRRLRRPRPRYARRPAARDGDGRGRRRDLPARQPRREARPEAQGPRRPRHPRVGGDARAARVRARGAPRSRPELPRGGS